MHIYRDLRPYICTFEDCQDPDQQYDSLHDWVAHESLKHTIVGNNDKQVYLKLGNTISEGQGNITTGNCIFCGKHNKSAVHVAWHLRRIALFALPRSTESESQSESPLSDFPLLNSSRGSGSKADAENEELTLKRSSMAIGFDDMSLENKRIHTGTSDNSAIHQTADDKKPHQDLPGDSANTDDINELSKGSLNLTSGVMWTERPHEGIPSSQQVGNGGTSRLKTLVDTHLDVLPKYNQEASTASDKTPIGQIIWYCCQCNFGPHYKSLYKSCISCTAMQCSSCQEEVIPY